MKEIKKLLVRIEVSLTFIIILLFISLIVQCAGLAKSQEIAIMPLAKMSLSPAEAAQRVGFSGVIDEAYTIGECVFIMSDGVVYAYGRGKADKVRVSPGNEKVVFEEEEIPVMSDIPKAFMYLPEPDVNERNKKHCDNTVDKYTNKWWVCLGEQEAAGGYYFTAISSEANALQNSLKQRSDKICEYFQALMDIIAEDPLFLLPLFDRVNSSKFQYARQLTYKYGVNSCGLDK